MRIPVHPIGALLNRFTSRKECRCGDQGENELLNDEKLFYKVVDKSTLTGRTPKEKRRLGAY